MNPNTKIQDDDIEIEEIDPTKPDDDVDSGDGKDDADDNDVGAPDSPDDSDLENDEEYRQYSARVQKRIKQLAFERHNERRAREAAERERDEAIRIAHQLAQRGQQLQQDYDAGRGHYYTALKAQLDAELESAKRQLRDAHEVGNPDKIVEAQVRVSDLSARKARLDAQPVPQQQRSSREQIAATPSQPVFQPRPRPSERAQRWSQRNPWFETNVRMRSAAMGIHDELVANGVAVDSDEYYGQIDREMRKQFPDAFPDARRNRGLGGDTGVAQPSRSAQKRPRVVRLTPTQLATAKRLGITPEAYAKEVLKLESKE